MQSNKYPQIVYVASTRLRTEKAHGLATVKICEAFGDLGADVSLFVPRIWRSLSDPFLHYSLRRNFSIKTFPIIDLLPLKMFEKGFFLIQVISFSLSALVYCLVVYWSKRKEIVIFSHDYMPLYFFSFFFQNIYYDIHHFPGDNFMYRRLMKKVIGFSVQTKWKVVELERRFSIKPEKIVYWPNGTEPKKFEILKTHNEARLDLNLSLDKKIVLYTGQLFSWKGVDTLIEAAKDLGEEILVYIVGGVEEKIVGNIHFVSFQPHEKIPLWLRAADILILPNTAREKVSLYYTSPMKLFEYMASGTPIVASDVPSIREIINEDVASFATADDPRSFADKIQFVLNNPDLANEKALGASKLGAIYTWEKRANVILEHISLLQTS